MTTTARRTAATAGAAICLALTLTACDPGEDPTPTPTDTTETTEPPTTDPSTEPTTVDYQQAQIEAAQEFVIDSYAADAAIRQDGFKDWKARIFPYYAGLSTDSELWQAVASGYQQREEEGVYIEGGTEVYSMAATDWVEDPTGAGFDTVTFKLCLDSSSIVYYDEDGTENTDLNPPDHYYPAEVEVMGQPDTDLGWSIMAEEADPSDTETC